MTEPMPAYRANSGSYPRQCLDSGNSLLPLDAEVHFSAMEVDLKELLDTIREENASSHEETRRQFAVVADAKRREIVEVDLKPALDTIREENASSHEETRKHFVVVAEGMRHELQIVAEGVTMLNEKLDRIASDLDARVTKLEVAPSRGQR